MDELETQIQAELSAITDFLEERLGRRSRWNGEVELSDDTFSLGKALWNGKILIDRALAKTDLRWRTEIHEALHFFSVGLTPTTYVELRGWEEGVVEQLQRQLRPDIFRSLNIDIPDAVFLQKEADHRYNRFIKALEDLRHLLGEPLEQFYFHLLGVPVTDRPAAVMAKGGLLFSKDLVLFRRTYALSFSLLRR